VNEGQVVLAQLNAEAISAESRARISDVIFEVVRAYWQLYQRRAEFIIQKSLVDGTEELLEEVLRRRRIDAQKALVAEVESNLYTQRADLENARINILRAQHQLVRLVGDRQLDSLDEMVPRGIPFTDPIQWDIASAFATALQNRNELLASIKRIEQSEVTNAIARHQILPRLALILESNVADISDNFNVPNSVKGQLSEQGPSYYCRLNIRDSYRESSGT